MIQIVATQCFASMFKDSFVTTATPCHSAFYPHDNVFFSKKLSSNKINDKNMRYPFKTNK